MSAGGKSRIESRMVSIRPATTLALALVVLDALLSGSVIATAGRAAPQVVAWAVAVRVGGALVLGAGIGGLIGCRPVTFLATTIGLLLADAGWFLLVFAIGAPDGLDLAINPVAGLMLLAGPGLAARSRMFALAYGVVLSVLVPAAIATCILVSLARQPTAPGSGLAQALTVLIAMATMVTGAIVTVLARWVVERMQRPSQKPR